MSNKSDVVSQEDDFPRLTPGLCSMIREFIEERRTQDSTSKHREPAPLELGQGWSPDGQALFDKKPYTVLQDAQQPSLRVALSADGSAPARFIHLGDTNSARFIGEPFPEWNVADARQVAKTVDAITTLRGGESEKVEEAIAHLETLLHEQARMDRVLFWGVGLALSTDYPCTADLADDIPGSVDADASTSYPRGQAASGLIMREKT
jgi:hypothetical protein